MGLMCAVEIVSNRETKAIDTNLRDTLIANCVKKQHLWIIGSGYNSIRFLPPLNITAEQINTAGGTFNNFRSVFIITGRTVLQFRFDS